MNPFSLKSWAGGVLFLVLVLTVYDQFQQHIAHIKKDMKTYRTNPRPLPWTCQQPIFGRTCSTLITGLQFWPQLQEDVQIFCMEVSTYNFLVLSNSEYFHHHLSLFMRSCISKPSHICTLVGLKKHNSLSQTLSMPQKELAIRQATEVGTWDKHRKKEFVTGEH